MHFKQVSTYILISSAFVISIVLMRKGVGEDTVSAGPDAYLTAEERAQVQRGQEVYKTNCQTCHGEKHDGLGDAGKYMDPHPRNLLADHFKNGDAPEQVFKTVTDGLNGTAMVSFGGAIPENDRKAVVAYITLLRKRAMFSAYQR